MFLQITYYVEYILLPSGEKTGGFNMKSDISFIAIGQGGCNIGACLEEKGFTVLHINTSKEDLDTLSNAKNKYHITDGEGSNRSRNRAKGLLSSDFEGISKAIQSTILTEYVYVVFTSSGGTGSGMGPALIDYLINVVGKKAGPITTLPSKREHTMNNINSYECICELEYIENMCTSFILDNDRSDKILINDKFANQFFDFVSIPENKDISGNIDKAEIKEILNTRGATVISSMDTTYTTMPAWVESLSNGIYANIEDDKIIKYIAVSTYNTFDQTDLVTKFGKPLDFYNGKNTDKTVCVLSGLSYPITRLNEIKSSIDEDKERVEKNLTEIEVRKMENNVNFLTPFYKGSNKSVVVDDGDEYEKPSKETIFAKYIN